MNAPLDEIHEMQMDFIRWIRYEIDELKLQVKSWRPAPCPKK